MDRRSARQPFGNSEREDVDPCASLAAVDGGTHEMPLAIDDGRHFYVELAIVDPFVLHAVWQPHVVIGIGPSVGLVHRDSDLRNARQSEREAGYRRITYGISASQNLHGNVVGLELSRGREMRDGLDHDIPTGIDGSSGGAHMVVDHEAAMARLDAEPSSRKLPTLQIRLAPRSTW